MILAGHETTANALAWALYLLAKNPAVAQALQDELATVLGGRPPVLADLAQLPLTDQVIKESLRLYPPAPVFTRQPLAATELGGYTIPADAMLVAAPYYLHRDPRFFVEPMRFWPERWAGGLERTLPRCVYFPFGAGPRICIGQQFALLEARLLLAVLCSRFRFTLAPGQTVQEEAAVTLRPKDGLRLRLLPGPARPSA
jgi:cytochrome P450